jgi:hypothetical protein
MGKNNARRKIGNFNQAVVTALGIVSGAVIVAVLVGEKVFGLDIRVEFRLGIWFGLVLSGAFGIVVATRLPKSALDYFRAALASAFVRRWAAQENIAPKGLLIDLLMPPDRAEEALFNILGRNDYWVAKHGVRKARLIFNTQSAGAVITFWADWLLRRVKLPALLRRS